MSIEDDAKFGTKMENLVIKYLEKGNWTCYKQAVDAEKRSGADIIAVKNDVCKKIQVKGIRGNHDKFTAEYRALGKYGWYKSKHIKNPNSCDYMIYVYRDDNEAIYIYNYKTFSKYITDNLDKIEINNSGTGEFIRFVKDDTAIGFIKVVYPNGKQEE